MEQKKEIIGEGKYMDFVRVGRWEFVKRKNLKGIVGIIAVTDDQKIILVEQHRMAVGKTCIEIPAGLAGDSPGQEQEDLSEAARRELFEETGYEASSFELIFKGPPSAGLSAEIITFYRARGLKKTGKGGGDESENIIVHEIPLNDVDAWLHQKDKEGILIDPKVWAGLYFAFKK